MVWACRCGFLLLILPLSLLHLISGAVPAVPTVPAGSTGKELPADNRMYAREYRWTYFSDLDTRVRGMRFQCKRTIDRITNKLSKLSGEPATKSGAIAESDKDGPAVDAKALERIFASDNPLSMHKLKMYKDRGIHEIMLHKGTFFKGVAAAAATVALKVGMQKLEDRLFPTDSNNKESGGLGRKFVDKKKVKTPISAIKTPPAVVKAQPAEVKTAAVDVKTSPAVAQSSPAVKPTSAQADTKLHHLTSAQADTKAPAADVKTPVEERAEEAVLKAAEASAGAMAASARPQAKKDLEDPDGLAFVKIPCLAGPDNAWMSAENQEVEKASGFEDFFAGLFKKIGAAPEDMGMKRFDRTKFPEQYPATLDEFADLLPTDLTWQEQAIRPMLARTSLQYRQLALAYDADVHGWDAYSFHTQVDRLGPGVVIARTAGGAICGGYNPKGWVGLGEYRGSIAAFLFTWPDGDCMNTRAIKLRKVGGSSLACVDMPETGPQFGADGLFIPLQGTTTARCKLGPYYERRPDGSNSIFAPSEKISSTQLIELKVYVGVYADGEEIPYDDALPFQLE